jgi:transcriptional antiterminator RfaH
MGEEKWYVLYTNPRAEKKVAIGLEKLGIEHYLPLYKRLKKYKDRKKYIETPLFNSYVFVKTSESCRKNVFEIGGIVKYLFVGGKIAVVTELEIDQIRLFCTLDEVSITPYKIVKGDKVEIVSGIFMGMLGILIDTEKGATLNIHIPSLTCVAKIQIDKKDVVVLK